MQPSDSPLLSIIADASARKMVAAKNDLPSGAIPVLLAVHLRPNCHPKDVQQAEIATPALVRAYLAQLVAARLVERSQNGRARKLRLTLSGLGVVGQYERALRNGRQRFKSA